jgi:hypothetical protein
VGRARDQPGQPRFVRVVLPGGGALPADGGDDPTARNRLRMVRLEIDLGE